MNITKRALFPLALSGLATLALGSGSASARQWLSKHFAENSLAGQVFDRAGSPSTFEQIKSAAASARFVMLGEIHPNPDHHTLQAQVLAHMIDTGRKPAVVFEMVTRAQQPVLDAIMANPPANAADIAARLEWASSAWPDFALYQPLFELALNNKLQIRAGNLEKSTIRRLGGRTGTPPDEMERALLGLATPLPDPAGGTLLEVIRTSHCNMLPDTVLPMMVDIQRARDHVMASAMLDPSNTSGAVLICGAGHARLDWGAGYIVERAAPGELVSVAFLEVTGTMTAADIDTSAHHFTMMTPREDITDHCAAFSKSLKSE